MTRGNQRDLAREKAQKKQRQQQKNQAASEKSGNKGVSMEKRRNSRSTTNAEFIFPEEQLAACEMKWNFS
ncbi:hypothetical protein T12_14160, partial [Trichinella patagoniensis]